MRITIPRRHDRGGPGILRVFVVSVLVLSFGCELTRADVSPAPGPSDAPCECVSSILIGIELGVALNTLFPLFIELAKELADGAYLQQKQVRIMKISAAGPNQEKTDVVAELFPLTTYFDQTTADFIAQRFLTRQVYINETLFGNYTVLFVTSPGDSSLGSPPTPTPTPNGFPGDFFNADTGERLGKGIIAIIVLCSTVVVVTLFGTIWLVVVKLHKIDRVSVMETSYNPPPKMSGGGSTLSSAVYSSTTVSFSSSFAAYTGSARTFSLSELVKATENFRSANIIGEGGFGRVFQGQLDDGLRVAVKVLMQDDQQGDREFLHEAELLSRLHHRNLVKLLGICAEGNIRALIYELIPNGSVESHLHCLDDESVPLNWDARIKIALGAARGLAYLHEDSNPRVIHRDFKASNILLEHDFTPKISDFGLAKVASEGGSEHITTRVMGTFGYVAPEYAMTGHLLVKSDVYSYGVVLLELLSGKKPVDMSQPPGQENLVTWARPLLTNAEDLGLLLDPALGHGVPSESLARVAGIASMCVQPEVSQRPFMGEVVQALKLVADDTELQDGGAASFSGSQSRDMSTDLSRDISRDFSFSRENGPGTSTSLEWPYRNSGSRTADAGLLLLDIETEPTRPSASSAGATLLSSSSRFVRQLSGSFRRQGNGVLSNSGPVRASNSSSIW